MEKKLIFIVGPTAIGKTSVAIKLCNHFNTEIISADSRQIYKEMNIGVARPTAEELKSAKHHFIATKSVANYYNASDYEVEANILIKELFKTHDNLIVVGGSGLYINALLYGIDDLPTIDPELRNDLQQKFEQEGIEELRFMLKKLDPVSYSKVDLKNPKRILKCLEVSIQTGKPYSSFLTGKKKKRDYKPIIFVLNMEREKLYDRINRRVEIMFSEGLINEVEKLQSYRKLPSLKTIGYREVFDYLDGNVSLDEAKDLIQRHTRNYARKQITWFRRNEEKKDILIDDKIILDDFLKFV